MTEDEKLALLKTILLTDDREYAESITHKINVLEEILRERHRLSEKVSPIIQEELEEFTKNIPENLGPVITESLKIQIENSKDEVVEALYPILGKMIKKYISQEIKVLSEQVNKTAKDTFSIQGLKRKFKSIFTGVSENEIIISDLGNAKVEQVFIIEKGSGILIGSFHLKETVDQDMISGMLTAIKGFVEDAFKQSNHDLQSIEYDLYEIHLHSFHKYYIATAVSGTFTETLENELENFNLEVSQEINKKNLLDSREALEELLLTRYSALKFSNQ
ncbi:cell envelope biogenesis protein OmpA [Nonlabens arenilitoris]|uniref:Cell envelope biogenesis protein OmpA n=1 Tax=Nonlabens arenilitoris TaxID=1217969 RepID=A0A2S7UAV5_9FLAO|nr:cell envelope biogenesis protein OmpA [Nonlabens arenilitoris]PQJ31760.1 cell envelope biogenesis protein OmpA [Nonlabens arenilitoris]